jgi:PHD/YefM family antitoxin component YafN of YafNO toxin-antitoxin module
VEDDFDPVEETLEILSDPEAMAEIAQAEADIEAGNVISLEDLMAELRAAGRIP